MMERLCGFDELLVKAAAMAASCEVPSHDEDTASCNSLFVVREVVNASGGRTGCFLYRGTLATPAPRSRTPDCCPWPRANSGSLDDQRLVPQLGGGMDGCGSEEEEGRAPQWSELEGQDLTLYLSYEEASPRAKQRCGAPSPAAAGSPWRVMLRNAEDDLLFCARGLPQAAQVDEEGRLAVWGPSVAIAFPTSEDARAFAAGLCRVEVQRCSLQGSAQAALLASNASEQRLMAGKAPVPAAAGKQAAAAAPSGLPYCSPPSPDPLAGSPRAGCKRPAEAPLLLTPAVKQRLMPGAGFVPPPTCLELLA